MVLYVYYNIMLLCYNLMGPPSYMRSVVDRNSITIIIIIIIIIIGIQPLGRLGRDQSSVRRLVWLWYAASWASS